MAKNTQPNVCPTYPALRATMLIGSCRDMRECRSHPKPTSRVCLSTPTASVVGPILSLDVSVTVAPVSFHRSYSVGLVEAHLRSQVSPLPSVLVLCIPRSTPGLFIFPTADLPIHLVVMPAAPLVSVMLSLAASVFLVFCRFVCPWSPILATRKSNHHTGDPTR